MAVKCPVGICPTIDVQYIFAPWKRSMRNFCSYTRKRKVVVFLTPQLDKLWINPHKKHLFIIWRADDANSGQDIRKSTIFYFLSVNPVYLGFISPEGFPLAFSFCGYGLEPWVFVLSLLLLGYSFKCKHKILIKDLETFIFTDTHTYSSWTKRAGC